MADRVKAIAILALANEYGMTISVDVTGNSIRIKGPSTELTKALVADFQVHKPIMTKILSLRERLRKGIDWFASVDKDLWDINGNPSKIGTKLENKMSMAVHKWAELERMLRNLYEYEGCIMDSGSCPEDSIVKCTACG